MQLRNSRNETLEVEWVSGPTLLGGRVVISAQADKTSKLAAFFEGSEALTYPDPKGNDMTVEGYTALVALTRKSTGDAWLVSLVKP